MGAATISGAPACGAERSWARAEPCALRACAGGIGSKRNEPASGMRRYRCRAGGHRLPAAVAHRLSQTR
ncbi:hypothetical protein HYPSUDRAFT_72471 [Hypholoma sublateritium FD-334 SS-4]|uniref:Uncharacterized protein n=1 Tax=Hypholoma sublateritium (strain FD-334 SS-4) TaxID=945553 RepID=A0A0D2LV27_HYPSF|nr:hypothetical protein HYPSUDRAFT_72471 [Hypholoma sublateritium FD-334 SS-4]